MTAMEKMVKARAAMILSQRFWGSLSLKLQLKEDSGCDTGYTDGIVLAFNPTWVDSLTMDETKGFVGHEVGHCMFNHHTRIGNRDIDDWNIAADLTINNMLLDSGFTLPKGYIVEPSMKDKSTEQIYDIIQGKKPKKGDDDKNDGKDQKKQPSKTPSDSQSQSGQGNDMRQPDKQPQNGKTDVTNDKPDNGQQPEQQNGQNGQPCNQKGTDPGGCGGVEPYPGDNGNPSPDELEREQQDWKIATASAANQAKACGQMPGGFAELINQMLEPKVDWKDVLQRFADQASRNDYSFKRTNPQYAGQGLIMPTLYDKELPPIDVLIDTSCSVSTQDLQQFVGEINDIRQHYKTTIRIVLCDTKVNEVKIIEQDDDFISLDCKGRGGTRFAPAIAWSQNQDAQPTCAIYLTDMQCEDFGPEPDFPVLWIQTEGKKASPPFGELVEMNPIYR